MKTHVRKIVRKKEYIFVYNYASMTSNQFVFESIVGTICSKFINISKKNKQELRNEDNFHICSLYSSFIRLENCFAYKAGWFS